MNPFSFLHLKTFCQPPGGVVQEAVVEQPQQVAVVEQPQQPLISTADATPANDQDDEEIYDPEGPIEESFPDNDIEDLTEALSPDDYLHSFMPSEQLPFMKQVLIPEQCTVNVCIPEAQGQSGQCSDPVHYPPQFQIAPRSSLRDRFEQGITSKRSRSPSGANLVPAQVVQDSPAYRGPASSSGQRSLILRNSGT